MLVKIILLFLASMALVAMIGKWLFPGAMARRLPRMGGKLAKPAACPKCGRHIIGRGGCDCGHRPAHKG